MNLAPDPARQTHRPRPLGGGIRRAGLLSLCCLAGGVQGGLSYVLIPEDAKAPAAPMAEPAPMAWAAGDKVVQGMLLGMGGRPVALAQARIDWPDANPATNIAGVLYGETGEQVPPRDLLRFVPALAPRAPSPPPGREATQLALLNGGWSLVGQTVVASPGVPSTGSDVISSYWLVEGLSPRLGSTSLAPAQEYPVIQRPSTPTQAIPAPGSLGLLGLGLLALLAILARRRAGPPRTP